MLQLRAFRSLKLIVPQSPRSWCLTNAAVLGRGTHGSTYLESDRPLVSKSVLCNMHNNIAIAWLSDQWPQFCLSFVQSKHAVGLLMFWATPINFCFCSLAACLLQMQISSPPIFDRRVCVWHSKYHKASVPGIPLLVLPTLLHYINY